jgi:integrase
MSVRKRTWTTAKGESKEAWIVDYFLNRVRLQKTFLKKKEADAWADRMRVEVRNGTHTPDSKSITVKEAGEQWLKACEHGAPGHPPLERATIKTYQQHLHLHIVPYLGSVRLSQLSAPMVRDFEDKLSQGIAAPGADHVEPRSRIMVKKIRSSLSTILADAQERGQVARNVVRELRSGRRRGKERRAERRQRGKLKVGVDIPTTAEIRAMLAAAKGRWRPLLLVAVFAGLRSSELRGLTWSAIDFDKAELHVRQRMDRYNTVGKPKSEAGERTVPLPPQVLSELRAWKLQCPKGPLNLVFPNLKGRPETHANTVSRGLIPTVIAAGVADIVKDEHGKVVVDAGGKPVMRARYTGMHALRHFFASWCINRKVDGGRELPPKLVQARLGHSSITITLDVYGHLFPAVEDTDELAAAEQLLLG